MIVQFVNQQTKHPVKAWKQRLGEILPAAFSQLAFSRDLERQDIRTELTVIFAGPNVMRRVNRETRGTDCLTDVLSFPILDMADGALCSPLRDQDFDLVKKVLPVGEIMISLDRAFEQAAEYGHEDAREVAFLAVHALLHLLGYDHQTERQEKAMARKQREILQHLGLARTFRAGPNPSEKGAQHE